MREKRIDRILGLPRAYAALRRDLALRPGQAFPLDGNPIRANPLRRVPT